MPIKEKESGQLKRTEKIINFDAQVTKRFRIGVEDT